MEDVEEGRLLLVTDPGRLQGVRIEGFKPAVRPYDGGSVAAGRMPPRAVSADVDGRPAVVSGGVWLAVLPSPFHGTPPVVRFRGPRGGLVAVPRLDAARTRRLDVDEECPACGAADWEETRAPEEEWFPGDPPEYEDLAARCRRCGHSEPLGVVPIGPAKKRRSDAREEPGTSLREELARASFHLYEPDEERTGGVCGSAVWTDSGMSVVSLTFWDGALTVSCDGRGAPERPDRQAVDALLRTVWHEPPARPGQSDDEVANDLRSQLARRRAEARAGQLRSEATVREISVPVDGTPRRCLVAEAESGWGVAPVQPLDGVTNVSVSGRRGDPAALRLRQVADPARYALGERGGD